MVFSSCENILNTCVFGLISSIGALVWTIKQEYKIRQIERSLTDGETL
jgi:hypothetical protein